MKVYGTLELEQEILEKEKEYKFNQDLLDRMFGLIDVIQKQNRILNEELDLNKKLEKDKIKLEKRNKISFYVSIIINLILTVTSVLSLFF